MAATPTGQRPTIAAEAFLRALADTARIFFVNPGTDFLPIVEAFSRAKKTNAKVETYSGTSENLAVGWRMAPMMTGRPQAVMVHECRHREHDQPDKFVARPRPDPGAGRTPITRKAFGSRSRPIHWAQEMFDQAGMVRSCEVGLRTARAGQIRCRGARRRSHMAHPRGPIYLMLPRTACSALPGRLPTKPRPQAARLILIRARRDIGGGSLPSASNHHVDLAAEAVSRRPAGVAPSPYHAQPAFGVPASSHSMHFGFDTAPCLPMLTSSSRSSRRA
jgi:acetolactate synthase-1/2/3 large subunit